MSNTISLNGLDWQVKGFIGEDWLWRGAHKPGSRDVRGWIPASVPGSIQNDLWQTGTVPDPYVGRNSLSLEWIPERTWLYKKVFSLSHELAGKRVQLVFQGVDYSARYFLNGELLGTSQGMFLPAEFEVGELVHFDGANLLVVVVDPSPFEQPQIGYTSRVTTQKARMNYWWDFCPRMIHIGIWEDVFLRVTGPVRLNELTIRPELSGDYQSARVECQIQLDQPADTRGMMVVELFGPENGSLLERHELQALPSEPGTTTSFQIERPLLWWPNGYGEQPLYHIRAAVQVNGVESDSFEETFGIRQAAFVQNEGAVEGSLPYNLVVNGRKIFINGWNWVPMDVLYGVERPEKRERLLRLANRANVNLLRVWGGGLIEKQSFYDLCDRLGILVWQEFIQSSSGVDNIPPEDPAFIDLLVRSAECAIRRRRNHPSLAVWCGGNELHYNSEHLCDSSHPALAALKDAVERLDPGRIWTDTSPAGGSFSFRVPEDEERAARLQDVHGPWEYQGVRGQYKLYNAGRSLLHSEFGVEGLTNRRSLDQVIPPEFQAPVSLENPYWDHLGQWWVKEEVWQEVFGALKEVDQIQKATQFIQAEGLRYAVEADRRRQFANGGTMPWQFNEPYPMAACTSAVDYFAEPKPVYYAVGRAYQPLTVTARFSMIAWGSEQTFQAEVWCSNTGPAGTGLITARVLGGSGNVISLHEFTAGIPQNGSSMVGEVMEAVRNIGEEIFFLDVELRNTSGKHLAANRYPFSKTETLAPFLSAPPARLNVSRTGDQITIANKGSFAALNIWLEDDKADLREPGFTYFSDNYLTLLPGEEVVIQVELAGTQTGDVRARAWNE